MSFQTHSDQALCWLSSPLLDGHPAIHHGFSTRLGGVSQPPFDTLNLAVGRGDDLSAVQENYRRFCHAVQVSDQRLIFACQVHETTVRVCTETDAGKGLWRERDYTADALVTNVPDLPLVVFSADCGIILLYDPVHHAVGAVHAGWRGCAAGILEKTIQTMQREFSSQPEQLLAAIGPCIGSCCFETDADVPEAMQAGLGSDALPYLEQRGAKWHVDLAGLNRQWLLKAGLQPQHIDSCGLCTMCREDWFWSYRRTGNARGAQVAVIALAPST